jgi:uroporphyrinogen decarboxylase
VDAGANAVQVFDSWGGALSPDDWRAFALPAARSVVSRVRRPGVPVIYFLNGIGGVAEELASVGADVVGVDFRTWLGDAIRRIGPAQPVQGNLDPAVLLGPAELIRERAAEVVAAGRAAAGHVFNLGHGIHRQTPPENVTALVDAVHAAGRRS